MQRTAVFLALIFLFAAPILSQAQGTSGSYTVAQANQTINNATAYINSINMSGYLVFYPNLSKAYYYLNQSRVALNKSPSKAVNYANLAVSSAKSSYQKIGAYREISLLIISVFTVIVGFILYKFMQPVKKRR